MLNKEVAIIGAGLTGLMLSIYLAKRGYKITIYDQRPDPRVAYYKYNQGRSMSLDLSLRGLTALSEIGLAEKVLSFSVPMKNRIIHLTNNDLIHLMYDTRGQYTINAISRAELHQNLILETQKFPAIEIQFNHKLTELDLSSEKYTLINELDQASFQISPFLLIGCDGANSTIRKAIEKKNKVAFQVNRFDYQYKELTVPASNEQHLEFEAMHMWPRKNHMLVAQPNYNSSFTCALLLPAEGEYSFQSLLSQSQENIISYFKTQFNDIYSFIPDLVDQLTHNPIGSLVTISEGSWSANSKILLLGDGAHAMVPFLGQGMNACFEDCYLLNQYLDQFNDDWNLVLMEFEKNRKIDTNAISTMSLESYPELTDPDWRNYVLHREIDDFLSKNYKDIYLSYHNLICFRLLPYRYANAIKLLQTELIVKLSSMYTNIKDITKEKIHGELIKYQEKLNQLEFKITGIRPFLKKGVDVLASGGFFSIKDKISPPRKKMHGDPLFQRG